MQMIRVYGRQRELPMAIHLFFFLSFSLFSCIRLTMNRFKEKSTVHGLIIIEHFILLVRYRRCCFCVEYFTREFSG